MNVETSKNNCTQPQQIPDVVHIFSGAMMNAFAHYANNVYGQLMQYTHSTLYLILPDVRLDQIKVASKDKY